jgi:predicted DNA-binding protein (MmcQ/YjbR family)
MNAERAREFLLKLPHVIEAEQWGGLIYWLGDKAIGGKMFVMLNLEPGAGNAISFPVGPERFAEMCEREGLVPAPYMARIFWVSAERWDALRDREWEEQLSTAHALTFEKLPPKTKSILAMPKAEQKRVIAERRKVLAAKEAQKKATKAATKLPGPP